jgi:hypothetical protein
MKRLTVFISLTVLCISLYAWSEEDPAGFSGTWILDSTKSDPFPRPLMSLGSVGNTGGWGTSASSAPAGGAAVAMGGGSMGGRGGGMPPGGMGGGMPSGGASGGTASAGKGPQAPAQNLPMVIKQAESELQIINTMNMNGKEVTVPSTYKCDGSEQVSTMPAPNSPDPVKVITKTACKKDKIQIRTTTMYPNNKMEVKRTFSLSREGKVLTIKSETSSAMMQTVQDQVYNRQ